jgi:hypothetical protein
MLIERMMSFLRIAARRPVACREARAASLVVPANAGIHNH